MNFVINQVTHAYQICYALLRIPFIFVVSLIALHGKFNITLNTLKANSTRSVPTFGSDRVTTYSGRHCVRAKATKSHVCFNGKRSLCLVIQQVLALTLVVALVTETFNLNQIFRCVFS